MQDSSLRVPSARTRLDRCRPSRSNRHASHEASTRLEKGLATTIPLSTAVAIHLLMPVSSPRWLRGWCGMCPSVPPQPLCACSHYPCSLPVRCLRWACHRLCEYGRTHGLPGHLCSLRWSWLLDAPVLCTYVGAIIDSTALLLLLFAWVHPFLTEPPTMRGRRNGHDRHTIGTLWRSHRGDARTKPATTQLKGWPVRSKGLHGPRLFGIDRLLADWPSRIEWHRHWPGH